MIRLTALLLAVVTTVSASAVSADEPHTLKVLSFNILIGGRDASRFGFTQDKFGDSRLDEAAAVIKQTGADLVGIQEDPGNTDLLKELGPNWQRQGFIYAKKPYQLELIRHEGRFSVCRVTGPNGLSFIMANCHWAPYPYGPYEAQEFIKKSGRPADLKAFEQQMLTAACKPKAGDYKQTLGSLKPFVEAGEAIFLTGDFNEPSHLDWSKKYANEGADRWPGNDTGVPLRFPVAWQGSTELAELGFRDSYREAFPNEVKHRGVTWTPPYPEGTPGRRSWTDDVMDRIDLVYYTGDQVKLTSAGIVGESKDWAEVVFEGHWPSDHRASLAEFELAK